MKAFACPYPDTRNQCHRWVRLSRLSFSIKWPVKTSRPSHYIRFHLFKHCFLQTQSTAAQSCHESQQARNGTTEQEEEQCNALSGNSRIEPNSLESLPAFHAQILASGDCTPPPPRQSHGRPAENEEEVYSRTFDDSGLSALHPPQALTSRVLEEPLVPGKNATSIITGIASITSCRKHGVQRPSSTSAEIIF